MRFKTSSRFKTLISVVIGITTGLPVCLYAQATLESNIETERRARLVPELREAEEDEESTEEIPVTSGDDDLGVQRILKRKKPKYKSFFLFGDYAFYHANNPLLLERSGEDDMYFTARLGGSFVPQITQTLFGEVTVSYQWFNYDELKNLDFESINGGGGLTWIVPELWNIALSGRYNYNRLKQGRTTDTVTRGAETFLNHSATFTMQKTFPITKAHAWYVGYSSELSWSDPASAQRDYHSLFLGYNASLTRSIIGTVYYKGSFVDYSFAATNDSTRRQDIRQLISLSLKYYIQDWLQITGNSSWSFNNSNLNGFDYDANTLGMNAGVEIRF